MDGRRLEEPESDSRFSVCCFWFRRFGNTQGKRRFCNRARSVCRSCCRVAIFLSRLRHGRLSEWFEPAIRGAVAREKDCPRISRATRRSQLGLLGSAAIRGFEDCRTEDAFAARRIAPTAAPSGEKNLTAEGAKNSQRTAKKDLPKA